MVPLMITTHHLDFLTQPPLPSTPNHNFSPYPRDIFAQVSNSFPAALFTPCLTMPLGRGPFRPFPSLPWTEESPPKTWGKDGKRWGNSKNHRLTDSAVSIKSKLPWKRLPLTVPRGAPRAATDARVRPAAASAATSSGTPMMPSGSAGSADCSGPGEMSEFNPRPGKW